MLLGLRDYLYPNYQTQTFWHFMFVTFQKTRTLGPCPEPIYVADKAPLFDLGKNRVVIHREHR